MNFSRAEKENPERYAGSMFCGSTLCSPCNRFQQRISPTRRALPKCIDEYLAARASQMLPQETLLPSAVAPHPAAGNPPQERRAAPGRDPLVIPAPSESEYLIRAQKTGKSFLPAMQMPIPSEP